MKVHLAVVYTRSRTEGAWLRYTKERAQEEIASYVKEWWNEELDETPPTEPAAAVKRYFDALEGRERYEILEIELPEAA